MENLSFCPCILHRGSHHFINMDPTSKIFMMLLGSPSPHVLKKKTSSMPKTMGTAPRTARTALYCTNRARHDISFHQDHFSTPLYKRAIRGHCSLPHIEQAYFRLIRIPNTGRKKFAMWVTGATMPILPKTDEILVVSAFDEVDKQHTFRL